MADINIYNELSREWEDLMNGSELSDLPSPEKICLSASDMSPRPIVLFTELEDARVSWHELLQEIRPAERADKLVTRVWTLKDLTAHVAAWAKEFHRQVEKVVSGESFDYAIPHALSAEGPGEWNQKEVEKRRADSLESHIREFDDETRGLQDLVLTLPQDVITMEAPFPMAPSGDPSIMWRGNIGQIVTMKCMHDFWHISRVKQWHDSLESSEGRG